MLKGRDTICVVDPDESVHDALSTLLDASGIDVQCFANAESLLAANAANRSCCSCLLVEADLPGMGSLALIRIMHRDNNMLPIIVLASTNDSAVAAQALTAGALDVIDKPLISVHLLERILVVAANRRGALTRTPLP